MMEGRSGGGGGWRGFGRERALQVLANWINVEGRKGICAIFFCLFLPPLHNSPSRVKERYKADEFLLKHDSLLLTVRL